MYSTVIIPSKPRDLGILSWAIEGYLDQRLAPEHRLEVLVGFDGVDVAAPEFTRRNENITISFVRLSHMGAASVRNALVAKADPRADMVIFANDDARPDPEMVQTHANVLFSLPDRSLVLGAAPWHQADNPSIFDALVSETPMVFSYSLMRPQEWYDFRTAYTINLSARYKDIIECGGFYDRIRPYYYEDLAFACRLIGPAQKRVWFEPSAKVIHRHCLTPDDYLNREELLGIMAPVVARECPEAFSQLLPGRTIQQIECDFRKRVAAGKSVHQQIYRWFRECGVASQTVLGQGDQRKQRIDNLYQLHLPLKLHAFRLGFLEGLELADDSHWQGRRPEGLWRKSIQADLLDCRNVHIPLGRRNGN